MVEKLRFAVGIATIWLAAVAGVSVTAWFAIDHAGRDVSGAGVSSLRPIPVGTAAGTSAPDSGQVPAPSATPAPSGTPSPSATPTPTGTPADSATPTPTGTSADSATPVPSASTRSATPTSTAPSPARNTQARPVPAPPPRDRTFSITGGQVSVRCTGEAILLRIAQPDDGWRVEVNKSGPREVDLRFQRSDHNAESRTRVTAVCSAGTPTFSVDNKG